MEHEAGAVVPAMHGAVVPAGQGAAVPSPRVNVGATTHSQASRFVNLTVLTSLMTVLDYHVWALTVANRGGCGFVRKQNSTDTFIINITSMCERNV